jgi:hypothetical protein
MARSVVVVVAALTGVALFTEHAGASPCGGSSDDDDSSSTFDDDWSSDTPSSSSAPSQPWSAKPPMTLDIGFAARTFASPLGTETGSVTHDSQAFGYRVVGPAARADAPLENAFVGQLRFGKPLPYNLYTGAELELGALTGASVATEMTSSGSLGTPTITPSSVMLVGGLGIFGIGGRVTSSLDLGVELAGGMRALAYQFDSTYLACETTTTVTVMQAVLEARARASLWLTPRVSLSALAGKSALDGGMVGGLAIGFTNHAFAGR